MNIGARKKIFFSKYVILYNFVLLSANMSFWHPYCQKCQRFSIGMSKQKLKSSFFFTLERFAPILKIFFKKKNEFWKMSIFGHWCASQIFFHEICYFILFCTSECHHTFLPSIQPKMVIISDGARQNFNYNGKSLIGEIYLISLDILRGPTFEENFCITK